MKIINCIREMKSIINTLHNSKCSIGFVPTMGALHAGHTSLCQLSKNNNDVTIVSIFVNSTQFNNPLDFDKYPSNIEKDIAVLKNFHIDYLFLPVHNEIYIDGYSYQVHENNFSKLLEGEHRPGHFTGVLTIVLKLCNILKPHNLYLGEKDYQQALLIRNMLEAFFIDTQVTICPTIRDEYGLALSSRNALLSNDELNTARKLNKNLKSSDSPKSVTTQLEANNISVEYIQDYGNRRFAAVKIGAARLIDNIELKMGEE